MSKITYSTKSDINTTATPEVNKVTAANMNEIKSVVNSNGTDLSNLQGTVIYTNPSGTDLNLVCSETISNFDYLQFDFMHQDYHSSMIVPIIDSNVQIYSIGIPSNNITMQFIIQKYTINNKTLELNIEGMVNISNTAVSYQSFTFGNQATIRVKKIIGIKK